MEMRTRSTFFTIPIVIVLISISITGILGYIQSELELRKFIPHRYFAYTTLCLAAIHVFLNGGKVVRYMREKLRNRDQ